MRRLLFSLLIIVISSCDKEVGCNSGVGVGMKVSGVGIVAQHPDLNQLVIRHHVPGTIDSFHTFIPCNLSDKFTEGMEVNYSGSARKLDEKDEPLTQFAGEEFFVLSITGIEEVI